MRIMPRVLLSCHSPAYFAFEPNKTKRIFHFSGPNCAPIRMAPPKATKGLKRDKPSIPTPTTEPGSGSAPGTPLLPSESEEQLPKTQRRQKAEDLTPLTPIQKAEDMCKKLLKKSDASSLALTPRPLPYTGGLSDEMDKFSSLFEFFDSV